MWSILVMPKSMADYKWEVGTVFLDNNHFKDAIRTYAIHAGRNLKFLKNDSKRVRVGCLGAHNGMHIVPMFLAGRFGN